MSTEGFLTQPLHREHDRVPFGCGIRSLDTYLREQATQDVRRHLAAVFVMPAGPDDPRVIGYYTLSSLAIDAGVLPDALRRRIPYREVPAALLGRLAVDLAHQGRGLGGMLLVDAAHRCLEPTAPASLALVVDPIDQAATVWYQRFGFLPFPSRADRLFAPLETLRRALEG